MEEYKCRVPRPEPNLFNCAFAGAVGVLASYPFDFIKTHLQTKRTISSVTPQCGSLLTNLKNIYLTEGVRRFYRGCLVFTLLTPFERVLKYGSFEHFRCMIMEKDIYEDMKYASLSGATVFGAFVQTLITTPIELIKIQQQTTGKLIGANGKVLIVPAAYLVKRTLTLKGPRGMYRGFFPTLARNTSFAWLFFSSTYAINTCGFIKEFNSGNTQKCIGFGTGLISGSLAAIATSPFDMIKTRSQSVGVPKAKTSFHIAKEIIHTGGKKALFSGASTRLSIFILMYGIAFSIYSINPDR